MSDSSYSRQTVFDLLHKIEERCPDLLWNMKSTYSDGEDHNFFRIEFLDARNGNKQEVITFNSQNGKILALKRPYFRSPAPNNIIDALLEILYKKQG